MTRPSGKTIADAGLTLLILNLLAASILRGADVVVFGLTLPTPSFTASAALVAAWLVARAVIRHGGRLAPPGTGAWLGAHRLDLGVALLFAAGLVIRLWGIGFGAPLMLHPDEHVVVGKTLAMLQAGSLQPPVPYQYPTVFYYLLLPAFALRYVRGKSAGLWADLGDLDVGTFELYVVARGYSAVFGALTIPLTYMLGRRMWPGPHGRWVGAVAAGLLTFSFNHVKESHYGVTDATLTLLIVVALLALVAAMRAGTPRAFALAGFATGLACATKYSALPLVFALLAAHLLAGPRAWMAWRRLAAAVLAVAAGFLTGYPYALLNWPPFLEHLGWMSSYAGSVGFDAGARLSYIARYAMESGLGLPVTLLLGAGIVAAVHRRRPVEIVAVVFITAALMLMANTAFPFYPRYLLPMMPLALLLAGDVLVRLGAWLSQAGWGRRWAIAVPAALALIAVAPQARESFAFVRYLASPDTRVLAYQYVVAQLPPGSVVATEEPYLTLPDEYELLRESPLHARTADEYLDEGIEALVFTGVRDVPGGGPDADARRRLQRRFPLAAMFRSGHDGAVGPTISIHVRPR